MHHCPQLCKYSERYVQVADGISSLHAKCPGVFSLPLSSSLKEGCCLAYQFPSELHLQPPLAKQALTTHLGRDIRCFLALLQLATISFQLHFPLSEEIKYAVIVMCSKEVCFTKRVLQTGFPQGNQSESLRTLLLLFRLLNANH